MQIAEPSKRLEQHEQSATVPTAIVRRGTGPRTKSGKRIASRNATKHGIFSKVVVLPSESEAGYKKLLAELRQDRRPVGKLEEILVERLANNEWRRRRLRAAETAEITKNMKYWEWDRRLREDEKFPDFELQLSSAADAGGLIQKLGNPYVSQHCQWLLTVLQEQIEENDFDRKSDTDILQTIYGRRFENHVRTRPIRLLCARFRCVRRRRCAGRRCIARSTTPAQNGTGDSERDRPHKERPVVTHCD